MMSQAGGHKPEAEQDVLGGPDRGGHDELAGPDPAECQDLLDERDP